MDSDPSSTVLRELLARHGLTITDIGLWELNEAFASQAMC